MDVCEKFLETDQTSKKFISLKMVRQEEEEEEEEKTELLQLHQNVADVLIAN